MTVATHSGRQSTLPPELFRPIMEHLRGHTHDLLACSTASKACGVDAQRVLFSIVIHLDGGHQRTIRFLNTIINSPNRLALHVHVLKLHMTYTLQEPILSTIPVAFRLMPNLKHLYFRSYKATPFAFALRGVKFELEGLDWGCRMDERELTVNFLPTQRRLKYIHLKDWNANGSASAVGSRIGDVCPSLECIDGPGSVLLALLPNHLKAKVVLWHPSRTESQAAPAIATEELSGELGRIECLSYTGMFPGHSVWNISRWLTSLRVLEFRGYERWDLYALSELRNLQHLILSTASAPDYSLSWIEDRSTEDPKSAEVAFAQSSSVEWVDIQIPVCTDYMRWRRPSLDEPAERILQKEAHRYRYDYTGVFCYLRGHGT